MSTPRPRTKIEPKYRAEKNGRGFVLYAGLLDAAHRAGLRSILTELVQAPTKENGDAAIVHASALFEDGRQFDGLADADRANSGQVANALVRLAETRAKGRALRDALNVAEAVFGDVDDDALELDDEAAGADPAGRAAAAPSAPTRPVASNATSADAAELAGLQQAWEALKFEAETWGIRVPAQSPPTAAALRSAIANVQGQVDREKTRRTDGAAPRRGR